MTKYDACAPLTRRVLSTRHGEMDMSRRTLLMAVLNVTPDSFSDGGRYFDSEVAIRHAIELAGYGADIIDIGGESTRPGARPVSADEEKNRVLPVIRALRRHTSIPLSVDTYKAEVARAALGEGADIVNDVSALRFDPTMGALVAREKVPLILMHMQGTPQTMQQRPSYENVLEEVKDFLIRRSEYALDAGVVSEHIIVDPGIGFGKELEHNLTLFRGLSILASLGYPLLVGPSRKAFIGKILDASSEHRLEGSLAAAVVAVLGGANIIRMHDVREAHSAIRIADAIRFGTSGSKERTGV